MNGTARATQFGYSLFEMVRVHHRRHDHAAAAGWRRPRAERAHLRPVDGHRGRSRARSTRSSPPRRPTSSAPGGTRCCSSRARTTSTSTSASTPRSIGLGRNPDDVNINGDVTVDAQLVRRQRDPELLALGGEPVDRPVPGSARWAVAQAAPLRRIDVRGDLNLAPTGFGWASGGYIADSRIVGALQPFSQQQWFTRDCQHRQLDQNAVWNMVFSACRARRRRASPARRTRRSRTTPVIREKPYLYVDAAGAIQRVRADPAHQHLRRHLGWPAPRRARRCR